MFSKTHTISNWIFKAQKQHKQKMWAKVSVASGQFGVEQTPYLSEDLTELAKTFHSLMLMVRSINIPSQKLELGMT